MRLLFLTNLYPPHDRGGLEQLCQEIRVGLQERGHTIEVLTSNYGTSSKIESANGVRRSLYLQADVEVYKPLDFFLNRGQQERNNVRELRQAIDSLSPDLIWIWGMWNLSKKLPYLAEQWMQIERLSLVVWTNNPGAIHLYEKMGFAIEGTMPAYAFHNGRYLDAYVMGRLKQNRNGLVNDVFQFRQLVPVNGK